MSSNTPTDAELRERLTLEQYRITQERETEAPFSGQYNDCHIAGEYRCVVCGSLLFSSDTKFDSGSGWPSFYDVAEAGAIHLAEDHSHGMQRIEATCANCGAHLGHVFPDGPIPTGQRYCINSAALQLRPAEQD